jgi:hypothetical protein
VGEGFLLKVDRDSGIESGSLGTAELIDAALAEKHRVRFSGRYGRVTTM